MGIFDARLHLDCFYSDSVCFGTSICPFLSPSLSPLPLTLLTRASLDTVCVCMYANNSFFQYKYGETLRKNHSKYARKDI